MTKSGNHCHYVLKMLSAAEASESVYMRERVNASDQIHIYYLTYFRDNKNVKKMHSAEKLNSKIREMSQSSSLVLINMPNLPKNVEGEMSCILHEHNIYFLLT